MTLTVWTDASASVVLAQLSEDEADGTPQEQIDYMSSIDAYAGLTCVDPDYTGPVPGSDPQFWRWSDGAIVSVTPVPKSVTPRQVRLHLLNQGLLDMVEAIIASSDRATKITWEFATEFRRDDPLLLALSSRPELSLTSDQIDQFFIAAANL